MEPPQSPAGVSQPPQPWTRGCSPAQGCHPVIMVWVTASALSGQCCRVGQRLLRAAGMCKLQWETQTHLSLLQSCLDITLLTLQGFLQLLQLMDGFATQTDLVGQISNFLWQGQKGVWSEQGLESQPHEDYFAIPLPKLGPCPPGPLDCSRGCAWGTGTSPHCWALLCSPMVWVKERHKDPRRPACPRATPPTQHHATAMALPAAKHAPFANKSQVTLPVCPVCPQQEGRTHAGFLAGLLHSSKEEMGQAWLSSKVCSLPTCPTTWLRTGEPQAACERRTLSGEPGWRA